ncbi:MAG: AbiU2 domain-containing protein [Myxococcaceae bacterium]
MTLPKLRDAFVLFRGQCIWYQRCLDSYLAFFPWEHVDDARGAVQATAPIFYQDFNSILREYCWLQASKLTDRKMQAGHPNLTAELIDHHLKIHALWDAKIHEHSAGLLVYTDKIKPARNWVEAHDDLTTSLDGRPVGDHKREDVEAFSVHVQGYVDEVGRALGLAPSDDADRPRTSDARQLLEAVLRDRRAVVAKQRTR